MTTKLDETLTIDQPQKEFMEQLVMPVIALRGLVVFPGMSVQFDVGRKKSILAVNQAMDINQTVFLVAQKDLETNDPRQEHLHKVGVIAKIKQVFRNTEDGLRLFVEGIRRAELLDIMQDTPFLLGDLALIDEVESTQTHRSQALVRRMKTVFEQYIQNYKSVPPDIIMNVIKLKECGELADYIAGNETALENTKLDLSRVDTSKVGTYQIPIKSLTSSAPMPVVKKAFANAFGDTLEVTVNKDGKIQAVSTLQNMIINMGSEYYANVLTIANGTTLSTKVEKSTQGMGGETLEVEVPEKISFELPQLDENNSTVLSITVDFMNYFMGQGKDYPTNVTLTLDLDNAKELQKEYVLEDGTYDVPVNVLKENSDDQSMAAQAVESAQITVQNNEVVVTLKLKEMTMYGQTDSVDKMEYQLKDGTYKEATVIEEEDGHPKKVQFKLDENKELTNVKFYYGGSLRGAIARLQLKLDGLTKVDPTPETPKDDEDKKDEENTSRFTKDGTYSVDVALWNATSDKESMAASAINSKAKIIVKDGKATMYLSTKEMSFGSIKASLQEFYIGSEQEDYKNHGATIIEKDAQGNPTLWAFELPHENEYINVMMNPHVAMMGNMDLAARLKIDYTTLTYVSDKTELEPNTKKDDQQENTNKDQTANKENQINENQSVKTGDQTSIQLFMTLFIISITMIGFILRKKHEA